MDVAGFRLTLGRGQRGDRRMDQWFDHASIMWAR
jgi:hypothetical protein